MRVLVLTPYQYGTAPGPRSSIELWERVLEPAGVTFTYAPFETPRLHEILYTSGHHAAKAGQMTLAYAQRALTMRDLSSYDAALVYREAALIGPEIFERWVARKGIPIIYQLDDPLYVPYRSPSNGYLSHLKFFGKVGRIARLSAVTVVNSTQHREYVSSFTHSIRQIPSVVDGDRFVPEAAFGRDPSVVRVGWSGSSSTVGNLRVIVDVLREISQRSDVELEFIGADHFDLPGVPYTARPWTAAAEVADLRRFDIGLVPLPVDEWTKRKFYLKLVQYMALGIPAVCTPLGSNTEVVDHGVTGFLASGASEWREALTALIEDHVLRTTMGAAAAERAHARYTLQAQTPEILATFRDLGT